MMTEVPENEPHDVRRKAYSYLRFSTPEQSKGDSQRRQTAMARNYASLHGLELDETLSFEDKGISGYRGKNASEGRLADFKEAVKVGLVPFGSVLLVEQLDRLSRMTPRKAMRVLEEILELGVSVVTLNDGRKYTAESLDSDPTELLVSVLVFMRANEESRTKASRLSAAWSAKRDNMGIKPLTSISPAWMTLNRETARFELIAERADLVRRVFDLTLQGVGQHKIAETFNSEGVAPWGRAAFWHRSYIAKILANPAVIGTAVPHVMDHTEGIKKRRALEPVPGYFPSVVPVETFDEVQALLRNKGAPRGRQATAPLNNILARLATCPLCDRIMTRVQKGRRSMPSLVCTAAKAGAGCEYKSIRYDTVERRLRAVLPGIISDREGLADVSEVEDRIAELEDGIHAFKETIEELLDELVAEHSPAITARIRKLERALPGLEDELRDLRERRDIMAGPVVGSRIGRAIAALRPEGDAVFDPAECNMALRSLFKKAIINWPKGTIDLEWHLGGLCHVHFAWRIDANAGLLQ